MSITVDARGLNCPQPVILTKRAMDENSGEEIVTLVDNQTALENVSKLAASQGYACVIETEGTDSHIHMTKEDACQCYQAASEQDVAILIKSQYFGQGNDELGEVLMKSFFYTLTEMGPELKNLIFMNGGVHLTTEGSPFWSTCNSWSKRVCRSYPAGPAWTFSARRISSWWVR